jgi:hypothetical protein
MRELAILQTEPVKVLLTTIVLPALSRPRLLSRS